MTDKLIYEDNLKKIASEHQAVVLSARMYHMDGSIYEYVRIIDPAVWMDTVENEKLQEFYNSDMWHSFKRAMREDYDAS